MPETKDNSLFYTWSLIEYIGREQKNRKKGGGRSIRTGYNRTYI